MCVVTVQNIQLSELEYSVRRLGVLFTHKHPAPADVAKGESQMNPIQETESFILVEGPKWADAKFYAKWLLMATKTQALWEKAIKDSRFKKRIDRLTVLHNPQFEHIASLFLFQLKENLVSFTFPLYSEDWKAVEQFGLMAEIGFFVLTDNRYQMAIPAKLNAEGVKSAALKLAKTEDEDGAHPEYLVAAMPYAQAEEWQTRLGDMDEEQRCADRAALLVHDAWLTTRDQALDEEAGGVSIAAFNKKARAGKAVRR
jgi:hypothetical protein